ncbi:restriction endonuclease subunit S [Haemophilus haemolyticus]|uniref:restriction endonuclease subunit S n=1 Tax=Haemophilus haemolyticus TaxID=726 RepID=UPI00106634B5|nr:restriction endonuclease subunit S [Haemophilus haemolyticus]
MKNNRTFLEKLLDGAEIEWKPLIKVASLTRGRVISKEYLANNLGDYPVYSSQTVNNGEIGKINSFDFDGEFVSWTTDGANAGTVFYRSGKFSITNVCGLIKIQNNLELNYKFLFYWLSIEAKNHVYSGMGNPKLMSHQMEKILIPIPPLSVQTEIVKILDTLTALTSELTSELILRRKQYEYYREKLLNIDEMNKVIELGDVGPVRMCKRILKNQTASSGDIPFYKIGTFGKKPDAYISNKLFQEYKQKYSYPKKGDILISASGTIGRTVIFDGQNSYFQDSNIVWIDNDETLVLNKYLYHFYKIAKWGIAEGGTIQRLYNDNLKKVKISIPPLKEQHRIVSILEKFETLTNSITEGLPLAIEQSKKRYEYYRELLLNFS